MFKKGRDRRQTRRTERKDRKEERRGGRTTGQTAAVGALAGAAVIGTGIAVNKHYKNKREEEAEAVAYSNDDGYSSSSSESDFEDEFEIKHLSEYTVLEVQFFFMAIGLESKCDVIEEKQINGQVLISLSATQLEAELGCNSFEIKKIKASIEFSFEITEGSKNEDKPTCKPPHSWTEAEVCLVLVAIGMGQKVEKIKECHVTGAVIVSASSFELQQECGMTSVEVKKFNAVVVKTEKGGCGIEPEVDTMPIDLKDEVPQVESDSGPNKVAIGVAVAGGLAVAGGIGYAAWKKCHKEEEEEEIKQEIQQEEELPPPCEEEDPDKPAKHPCDWTTIEVKYFLVAIGFERKCNMFEEKEIDGKALVKITKQELKVEYGCSSMEIKKFTCAIEFSIEIAENPPTPDEPDCGCKPPKDWSEVEICLVLVAIGMGTKVKKFKQNHVSGAMLMSMTKVELTELQKECGMSSVEVKKFKGVAVKYGHKTSSSGGGSSSGSGYKKTATVAAVSATAVAVGSSGGGSCEKDEEVEKPPMKQPCDWTKMEVQYFLIAIGFDRRKCEEFKEAGVTGKVLVSLSKAELEGEYGCSSVEIKKFMAALEFSVEVTETECGCKSPQQWTEIEVCMVMISIGLGTKVEKIHRHHITGAVVISMETTKLQEKCSMTATQVTKFKAVVGVSVTVTGGGHSGGGGGGGGGCKPPPMEHPCEWSKMEVQYFLIAIGFSSSKCEEFKDAGVTGKVLVKLTKAELESDYGCSSAEIKKFTAALSFSKEVVETKCGCKKQKNWTEVELCMAMISVGLGTKVEYVHKHQITGAVVISMSSAELQDKCDMTEKQVTKFKAVVGVKVSGGGGHHSRSPSRSRSPSPEHCSGGKAVKVTKTTVTKTTTYHSSS